MENELQNSLTSPLDKDPNQTNTFKAARELNRELTREEGREAMLELNDMTFIKKFPKVEKFYADPLVPPNQSYGLISFVPSSTAKPDADGVYGMVKIRGCFSTEEEAITRADYLIKNVDSYHSIYHVFTGRPFPLTKNKKYIPDVLEIDIKKKITEENSKEIRAQRDSESNVMKEILEKQEELQKDTALDKKEDPLELYTELQVKKAHLVWTYKEQTKKMEEMKQSIIKTRNTLKTMDEESAEYRDKYMDRYRAARAKSGLPNDDQSFLKYMAVDVELELGF